MWTRKLLKENGKIAFKRNYWACVAVCVIAMLLGAITGGDLPSSSSNSNSVNINNNVQIEGFEEFNDITSDVVGTADLGSMLQGLFSSIPSEVYVIFGVVLAVAVVLGICMSILVSNVVAVGCSRFFMENREHKTKVGQLFFAFRGGKYLSTVLIMFVKSLYVFLWTLALIVPGIIKAYSYYLVTYIVAENSELDKNRVLKMSSDMMKGHKWEAFVLELSFIGWTILGSLTFGLVNIFYTNPYMQATKAEFYAAIKAEALQKGTVSYSELPGVSIPVSEEFVEVV